MGNDSSWADSLICTDCDCYQSRERAANREPVEALLKGAAGRVGRSKASKRQEGAFTR